MDTSEPFFDVIVRGGQAVLPNGLAQVDIGVRGGKIAAIAPMLAGAADWTIQADGRLVLPGLVDPHVHLGIPIKDTWSADDFTSGSVAAACGGVTTLLDFTVQRPGQSLRQALEERLARAQAQCHVDYGLHVNITDQPLAHLGEIAALIAEGFTSFKAFTTYREAGMWMPWPTLRQVLAHIGAQGGLLMLHAEDNDTVERLTAEHVAAGRYAPIYHPRSRPAEAEALAIEQAAAIAAAVDAPLYIVHLSSRLGLEAARQARAQGVRLFLETCPQYLVLDESAYLSPQGHHAITTPPLRTPADAEALWQALAEGEIDTVGTDHCPFTLAQKDRYAGRFDLTPNGLPAVETRLSLLYTYGVAAGRISLTRLVEVAAQRPAALFGLAQRKGALAIGWDADMVVFDPTQSWRIMADNQHGAADWTPYAGHVVQGRVETVLLRGQALVSQGAFVGEDVWGQLVLSQRAEK